MDRVVRKTISHVKANSKQTFWTVSATINTIMQHSNISLHDFCAVKPVPNYLQAYLFKRL